MNKLALILISAVLLTACQTTTSEEAANILDVDFPSMNCAQIKQVFTDYNAKIALIEGDLSASLASDYKRAKEIATPVMMIKGCSETL